jgi:dihydrolipoamide dehydrogenase
MTAEITVYDLAIIGGGPGGYVAAIRARQLGARVALIEMDRIGGTCLNRGCIPTKAMVSQAEMYLHVLHRAREWGIEIDGTPRLDFQRFMARKDEVTETLVSGVEHLVASHGITVIKGKGRILSPNKVLVNGETEVECRKLIIATGSVPARLSIPGANLPGVITSDELLKITQLPRSMVVIGGSVVGIEFASIFTALGTKVTVLGRKTFLKDTDDQLAKRYRSLLAKQGTEITIGVDFKQIVQTDAGTLRVEYEMKGKPGFAEGELVLLSTGRTAYTDGLGIEDLGIEMEGRNIKVNKRMETNIPGIYAIGDVIPTPQLAHVASYEGEIAVENALGHPREADYRAVPACIFTIPEIASVGLTSTDVKEMGIDAVVERFPFNINGRALAMGETEGQIRMICEKTPEGRGGKILGVHIMGPHASDLIAEAALAIQAGMTARELAETIHAHPTIPEVLMEVAKAAAFGEAIHYRKV